MRDRLEAIYQGLLDDMYGVPGIGPIEDTLLRLASCIRTGPGGRALGDSLSLLGRNAPASGIEREAALTALYQFVHRGEPSYSREEGLSLGEAHGCPNLPGGLAPVLMAASMISPDDTVLDLGAGNGLQGLLMQALSPHALTVQAELSASMIATGRRYQQCLAIPEGRVLWHRGDLLGAPMERASIVYMYRPSRPTGRGRALYQALARRLEALGRPVLVISVADCLRPHLGSPVTLYERELICCYETMRGRLIQD